MKVHIRNHFYIGLYLFIYLFLVAQSCPTYRPQGLEPTRLLRPWDFPGKSTGVRRKVFYKLVSSYTDLTNL